MPGYKIHICFSAALYAMLLALSGFFFKCTMVVSLHKALEWFMCMSLGALFPDIDIKSKGQILFYECIVAILLFLWWSAYRHLFIIVAFLALVPLVVRHRGLFHRPWFVVSFPLIAALVTGHFYPRYFEIMIVDASFFSIGALSHCFLDALVTKVTKKKW